MRRITAWSGAALAIIMGLSGPVTAQTTDGFAEGERKAAAGDIKGALVVYEDLTRSHPDSYRAFAHLGGMQLLDQRYADAVKSFQQAITLGDEGTRSFVGMGMAYLHMGQLGPARAAFVEARSRGVDNPQDIDQIISWIDTRGGATPPPSH